MVLTTKNAAALVANKLLEVSDAERRTATAPVLEGHDPEAYIARLVGSSEEAGWATIKIIARPGREAELAECLRGMFPVWYGVILDDEEPEEAST